MDATTSSTSSALSLSVEPLHVETFSSGSKLKKPTIFAVHTVVRFVLFLWFTFHLLILFSQLYPERKIEKQASRALLSHLNELPL